MSRPAQESGSAPWFPISETPVLSVEHPFIVHNVDKAVEMLGGPAEVSGCLEPDSGLSLGLKFEPKDPVNRSIISFNKPTNNLLLRFTLPRRTGRKRKRGSNDDFVEDAASAPRKDTQYLLRSLRENPSRSQTEVVGMIHSTHIWRTMPDFVYSASGSAFLEDLEAKILPQDYTLLKGWSLPHSNGLANTESFPPPVYSTQSLPNNYTYRQNPAVKTIADPSTGKPILQNVQKPARLRTYQCQYDDPVWPTSPPPDCTDLMRLDEGQRKMYKVIRDLFEERPVWTRRALTNYFPDDLPVSLAREVMAYVAFAIRSGPWRDTFCRYGVDPRSDRSYRKYQSVLLQLYSRDTTAARDGFYRSWQRSKDKRSHIMTGTQGMPSDGKVWQLCDLEEPRLKRLVDLPELYIRAQCERRYFGWYSNGTMAKIRVALKTITDALISGNRLDDASLDRFLKLPEQWDPALNESSKDPMNAYLPKDANKKELEWASAYRSLCRTRGGSVPRAGASGKGRLTKTKPTARASFLPTGDGEPVEECDPFAVYDEPTGSEEEQDEQDEQEEDDEREADSQAEGDRASEEA